MLRNLALLAASALRRDARFRYLEHEACDVLGFKVFGSPHTSEAGGAWAFHYDRGPQAAELWADVPDDVDVLAPLFLAEQIQAKLGAMGRASRTGRGAHTRSPMPGCDVLLTHSPPKFLLDKCYNGENAGSTTLRHAVEQSLAPPQLWICGHVHEARGHAYLESAVGAPKTLVLNAANANVGRASHLVAAPCVADVLPRVAEAADASGLSLIHI